MKIELNQQLIESQNLSYGDICDLEMLHANREVLFERMQKRDPTDPIDLGVLRRNVETIRRIEYAMQKAWHFTQDADFHSWWFQAPHCKCPHWDNWDLVGTRLRSIDPKCPLHGS